MTYRAFCRVVWTRNPSWPDGYEPHAVPADRCRTLGIWHSISGVRAFCDQKNRKWRKYDERRRDGLPLSAAQLRVLYESPRYEFEEVTS